jgi:hypothetical protein
MTAILTFSRFFIFMANFLFLVNIIFQSNQTQLPRSSWVGNIKEQYNLLTIVR